MDMNLYGPVHLYTNELRFNLAGTFAHLTHTMPGPFLSHVALCRELLGAG